MRVGRAKGQEGATLVEFAVVLPLLLLLIMGIIEFGRLAFSFAEVWSAAREGARFATTAGDNDGDGYPNFVDCDGITAAALGKVTFHPLTAGDVSIVFTDGSSDLADCATPPAPPIKTPPNPIDAGNLDPGTEIVVSVSASYDAIVPLVGGFVDGVSLSSTQTRSVHYQVNDGS